MILKDKVNMLLLMVFMLIIVVPAQSSGKWINKKVSRKFDITKHVVKLLCDITATPVEQSSIEYSLPISKNMTQHLAFISVSIGGQPLHQSSVQLKASKIGGNFDTYTIKFDSEIKKGDQVKFRVKQIFTNILKPFPEQISQLESQKVLFYENIYLDSPYETTSQTTQVKTGLKPESYSEITPVETKKGVTKYGPFKSVPPFSYSKLRVHFVNNEAFATFTSVEREIEISHWGNVAVEEVYDLKHAGASLVGEFSRADFHKHRSSSSPYFQHISASLPGLAHNVYYRDIIGNISSSNFSPSLVESKLDLTMRFPLYGGWKTNFYMGYSLPTSGYLKSGNGRLQLSIDLGTPFTKINSEELTVRVILPEGSTDIEVDTSGVEMEGPTFDTRFTFLDRNNIGRPVVELHKSNVVNEHNQKLIVTYSFNKGLLLREPLMLVSLFAVLFSLMIFGSRIELSFDPKKDN